MLSSSMHASPFLARDTLERAGLAREKAYRDQAQLSHQEARVDLGPTTQQG